MKLKSYLLLTVCILVFNCRLTSLKANTYRTNQKKQLNEIINKITFTENKGQLTDTKNNKIPEILFTTESKGIRCFLSKKGISYVFATTSQGFSSTNSPAVFNNNTQINLKDNLYSIYRLDMELLGTNPFLEIIPLDAEKYYQNFYQPHCESGILSVRNFNKILYKEIYNGIDMIVYSIDNKMKYDFIIRPRANINDIKMKFSGAEDIKITKEGKLKVSTPMGYIQEDAPFTFQENGGKKIKINSSFSIKDNIVSFTTGNYDKNKLITIDPTRQWATFIGGSSDDWVFGSSVDNSGNIYLSGFTNSTNLPATTGAHQSTYGGNQDAFLAKVNSNGSPVWITYYGGNSTEDGRAVSIDKNGGIYLNGFTKSTNFPVSNGAFQTSYAGGNLDAFLVKFNSSGVRQWATYFGGSGTEYGVELSTDSKSDIILVGFTNSTNLPVTSGAFQSSFGGGGNDGFAVKFNNSGSRQWATYYGGSGEDRFYAVATDTSDNYYLTGSTTSTNFPVTSGTYQSSNAGSYDVGIVKINSSGTRQWATYYGGSGEEISYAASIDINNNLYLTGYTKSTNFPVSNGSFQTTYGGGYNDGFLTKFSASGSRIWSTFFGGSAQDDGYRMTIDKSGIVYVSGYTLSSNFPVTSNAVQSSYGGGARDAFLIYFDQSGSRQYSTYYGGSGDDYSAGISIDGQSNIYLAGSSYSSNLPITSGAYQTSLGGGNDIFLVKFSPDKPVITASGPLTFCDGEDVILSTSLPYSTYQWSHGPTTRSVTLKTAGKYVVTTKDANNLTATSDTVEVIINPKPKVNFNFLNSCQGQQVNFIDSSFISTGTLAYNWNFGDGRKSALKDVSISYATPGNYNIKLVVNSNNGCKDSITKTITIYANPKADFTSLIQVCKGNSLNFTNTSIIPGSSIVSYKWTFGDGNSSTQTSPIHTFQTEGQYNIKLVVITNNGCKDSITKQITVQPQPVANFSFINDCTGNPITFNNSSSVMQGTITYDWKFGNGGKSTDQNPVFTYSNPGTYDITLTVTTNAGCKDSVTKTITIYPRPTKPVITANSPANFCDGDSVILNAGTGYNSYIWSTGDTTQNIVVKQSGNYSVKVSNINGCIDSSLAFTVNVYSKNFNLAFTESQRIISAAPYSVVFTNTTPDATKYDFTWKFGDGKTSTQESPIYSYQDSGLFSITLIAKNKVTGCTDSLVKKDWILINKTTGINDIIKNLPNVKIYPNPTTSGFYIDIDNIIKKDVYLILHNGLGRKLDEKHLKHDDSQKNINFDINFLPKGIYFLQLMSNNLITTYKIIKQ